MACAGLLGGALGTGTCSETENCPESPALSSAGRKPGAGGGGGERGGGLGLRGAGAERDGGRARGCAAVSVARVVPAPAPAPGTGRDGAGIGRRAYLAGAGGGAYLEVGSPLGYPAHHDVGRGHGPSGREAEAHVAGCAHLEAEGEPVVPRAPAQPVLALRVEEGAVREGPARAPRGRAGEQRPQQE